MRSVKIILRSVLGAGLIFGLSVPAFAQDGGGLSLQDVEVGGSIRARANAFYFDNTGGDTGVIEQRTRLGIGATVSDTVSAMVEMQAYGDWGDDFASNPLTGLDMTDADDVALYQGYFDVAELGGTASSVRVGRQELVLGNEWLVGNNNTDAYFPGLSYDGLNFTLGDTDYMHAQVFAMQLAETGGPFEDEDAQLFGVYASNPWCDGQVWDLYWLWLRDEGPFSGPLGADETNLHTIGTRIAGDQDSLDYALEVAYQFGEAETAGLPDQDADTVGLDLELGYTFAGTVAPRAWFGFAYLPGDDEDMAFNRMFSDVRYSQFDLDNSLTNLMVYRVGMSMDPSENTMVGIEGSWFQVDEEAGADDDLGFELHLLGQYDYADYLAFRAGWALLDAGDAAAQGNAVLANGTSALTVDDSDTWHYWYLESELTF